MGDKKTFKWRPLIGSRRSSSHDILRTKFLNGYEQRVSKGINNRTDKYDLAFRGKEEEILAIRDFIDEHRGYISFKFTPLGDKEGLFIAESSSLAHIGKDIWEINVNFERVHV